MTHALARRSAQVTLLVLLAAAGSRSSAQQARGGSTPGGRMSLVSVDFRAIARDGGPVPDLKLEDITIKVDGKARQVRSLRFIQVPAVPTGRGTGAASGPLPPPYGSNVEGDASRTIIIVLDDDSFRPGKERPLRAAVDRFLPELSPRDRVALVNVPYGGVKVDFTTDHDKVRQVLSKMVGQAPQDQTGSEAALRTRRTLESLSGLLQGLGGGGEGPTTVLFFSSSLLGPRRDAPITMAPGMAEITTEHFEQVGVAASAARAQFYIIQPEDLIPRGGGAPVENIAGAGFKGSDNPLEGIEHLAGVTGGERLSLAATGESTLSRVTRETTGYYLASFEPEAADRNGAAHRLNVGVAREDVEVRARPGLTIPKVPARGTRQTASTPRDMLKQAEVFRDLPLRATAFVSQEAGDARLKIIALAESIDPSAKLTSAAAGLFDAKGRLTAQWTASDTELAAGRHLMAALMAPPGTYRLRVAAVDSTGRTGSADHEVTAELVRAGPLQLSAIVLGLSRGGFVPKLEFGDEPVALAYLEIYGPPQPAPIAVTVELARAVNAPALLTVPGAVAETSASDRRTATAALPIGGLAPGDYIVRAVVGVQGQPSARVLRTIRKVRPS